MELAALVISLISALLALGSLLVSYMSYKRDTPLLAIRHHYTLGLNEPATLGLDVTNVGKRTTTLEEVGFRVEFNYELDVHKSGVDGPFLEHVNAQKNIVLSNGLTPLAPGEMKKFVIVLNAWPDKMVHADFPLRGYAVGSHGKTCWGHSRPFLREMLNHKWQPPKGTPEQLLAPYNEKIKPMPVYPAWKFWKPKHLRK